MIATARARAVAHEALGQVFDPALVTLLREDSALTGPESVVGMGPADAVALADAVAAVAQREGATCELRDVDLAAEGLREGDLVSSIAQSWTDATPGGSRV